MESLCERGKCKGNRISKIISVKDQMNEWLEDREEINIINYLCTE